jgi:hypothetical protein
MVMLGAGITGRRDDRIVSIAELYGNWWSIFARNLCKYRHVCSKLDTTSFPSGCSRDAVRCFPHPICRVYRDECAYGISYTLFNFRVSQHNTQQQQITTYRVFTKEWCGFKNLLNDYILQLDGPPPLFRWHVRELLIRVLQQRWIGRAANGDNHIHILYGTNSLLVGMCVVWPRVHTVKDYE